jgi:hypothetical protein
MKKTKFMKNWGMTPGELSRRRMGEKESSRLRNQNITLPKLNNMEEKKDDRNTRKHQDDNQGR